MRRLVSSQIELGCIQRRHSRILPRWQRWIGTRTNAGVRIKRCHNSEHQRGVAPVTCIKGSTTFAALTSHTHSAGKTLRYAISWKSDYKNVKLLQLLERISPYPYCGSASLREFHIRCWIVRFSRPLSCADSRKRALFIGPFYCTDVSDITFSRTG